MLIKFVFYIFTLHITYCSVISYFVSFSCLPELLGERNKKYKKYWHPSIKRKVTKNKCKPEGTCWKQYSQKAAMHRGTPQTATLSRVLNQKKGHLISLSLWKLHITRRNDEWYNTRALTRPSSSRALTWISIKQTLAIWKV